MKIQIERNAKKTKSTSEKLIIKERNSIYFSPSTINSILSWYAEPKLNLRVECVCWEFHANYFMHIVLDHTISISSARIWCGKETLRVKRSKTNQLILVRRFLLRTFLFLRLSVTARCHKRHTSDIEIDGISWDRAITPSKAYRDFSSYIHFDALKESTTKNPSCLFFCK